jgi:hypothetical protein
MHEFFFENLRNPARSRRVGLIRQFCPNHVYSSAKSFEVLPLIFLRGLWLHSELKIRSFETVFLALFFCFFENQAPRSRGGDWICMVPRIRALQELCWVHEENRIEWYHIAGIIHGGEVMCSTDCAGLDRRFFSESEFMQEELFCITDHSAASPLFGDRISAPGPRHAVAPRRA